ncbi:MAG: CTP synthetase [Rhodobacteraceae bacterium]|nr:CTP synthetase [Paracoccaceae bacterium]TVR47894.1 MAG: CTP synthetase [Paracoccaceae bacterium]
MSRLFPLMYSIVGVTCAGIGVVAALSTGHDTLQPILVGAAAGAMIGVVPSWLIARRLLSA